MKKENTKAVIAKKKKNIKTTCYISLVILVILLFLPMMLRIFVKEKKTETVKKDIIILLNCNKSNESISSTFLNDEPQNILYNIKGDYTVTINPDETTETSMEKNIETSSENVNDKTESSIENNIPPVDDNSKYVDVGNSEDMTYLELVRPLSSISYDPESDLTSIRTDSSNLQTLSEYQSYFSNVAVQTSYFVSQGFSCTQSEL